MSCRVKCYITRRVISAGHLEKVLRAIFYFFDAIRAGFRCTFSIKLNVFLTFINGTEHTASYTSTYFMHLISFSSVIRRLKLK